MSNPYNNLDSRDT